MSISNNGLPAAAKPFIFRGVQLWYWFEERELEPLTVSAEVQRFLEEAKAVQNIGGENFLEPRAHIYLLRRTDGSEDIGGGQHTRVVAMKEGVKKLTIIVIAGIPNTTLESTIVRLLNGLAKPVLPKETWHERLGEDDPDAKTLQRIIADNGFSIVAKKTRGAAGWNTLSEVDTLQKLMSKVGEGVLSDTLALDALLWNGVAGANGICIITALAYFLQRVRNSCVENNTAYNVADIYRTVAALGNRKPAEWTKMAKDAGNRGGEDFSRWICGQFWHAYAGGI